MEALFGIGTAFGLSTSAGLNAYIPLLLVSVLTRFGILDLQEPYTVLGNIWVIAVVSVLLLVEVFVDKIPAVDTVNDVVQTAVRPAAGALLFAANANVITDINPVIAVIAGLFLAGTVHTAKGAVRPLVTASTGGMGNWVVSIIEDVIAVVASILAIIMPFLVVVFAAVASIWLVRWYRKRKANEPQLSITP